MEYKEECITPKKIKTILLCKVKPEAISDENDYSKVYQKIYCGSSPIATKAAEKYITIGNVDAVSIYDTIVAPYSNNWFKGIYDDKQDIIREINESVTYHPIHLISNAKESKPPAEKGAFPFCVITLIYGINPNSDYSWGADDTCSRYEAKINSFLQKQNINPKEMRYTAYNAVNICDAVIIWNTTDISKTLELSNQILIQGLSRKTYTIVGFPMSENGTLASDTFYSLPKDRTYNIRIQGSIRDYDHYRKEVRNPLLKSISDAYRRSYFLVCGSEDFLFLFKNIDTYELKKLLPFLLKTEHGRKIAHACWDIHTEFMLKDEYKPGNDPCPAPVGILNDYYGKFLKLSTKNSKLAEYPWYGAFLEVLGVYSKIDQHPILYGPCYLIYDIIRIAYHYFSKEDKDTVELVKKSYDSIQVFLRNWSEFTDQMTRIDDLVFHGFGSTSALYNTLPESALDFYHSFLLQCVDLLVAIDCEDGRLYNNTNEYAYDFLLVPELYRGISIQPIFNTYDKNNDAFRKKKRPLSPLKQVYLVRFPIKTVYHPSNFFAPLMHECFHHFGDVCRLRRERKSYIIGFLANRIVVYFKKNSKTDKELFLAIYKKMHSFFPDDIPEPNDYETRVRLEECIQLFFTPETFDSLYAELEDDSFYDDEFMFKWVNAKNMLAEHDSSWKHKAYRGDWNSVLYDCLYYFKECYADLMMILTLKLSPREYLMMFQEDFKDASKRLIHNNLVRDTQRVAIVLATCAKALDECEWNIGEVRILLSGQEYLGALSNLCSQCVEALNNYDVSYKDTDVRQHPPAVLNHVKRYLDDVVDCYNEKFEHSKYAYRLKHLRKQYKKIFKEGGFFSREFFEIIHEHHESIRHGISLEKRLDNCSNNNFRC